MSERVPTRTPGDISKLRHERLIPSLATSFAAEPLKIVKVCPVLPSTGWRPI